MGGIGGGGGSEIPNDPWSNKKFRGWILGGSQHKYRTWFVGSVEVVLQVTAITLGSTCVFFLFLSNRMKDVPTSHSLVGGLVSRITDKGFGIGLSKMGEKNQPVSTDHLAAMRPAFQVFGV